MTRKLLKKREMGCTLTHLGEAAGLQGPADDVHGHQNADGQHEELSDEDGRVRDGGRPGAEDVLQVLGRGEAQRRRDQKDQRGVWIAQQLRAREGQGAEVHCEVLHALLHRRRDHEGIQKEVDG